MKSINKILLALVAIAILASCDKINPPFTEDDGGQTIETDTVRKILLEEFTGHKCPNCPDAHVIAHDLKSIYGNQLILLTIHAGYFANVGAAPFVYDFKTTAGNDIASNFQLPSTPMGMVNRVKQSSGWLIDKDGFGSNVSAQIDEQSIDPELYITLIPTYNQSDSTLNLVTKTYIMGTLESANYNICVAITEDSIIKPQIDNGEIITDYVHMHVMRGMVSPTWGDQIFTGVPTVGNTFTKNYTGYKLGKDWNPDNCHIVAYVYYANGEKQYQIIQAQEVKLK